MDQDFSTYYDTTNIESLWSLLMDTLEGTFDSTVPKVFIRNTFQPKWYNSQIIHQLKVCSTLRRLMHSPTLHVKEKLAKLKSELQTNMYSTKSEFKSSLIEQFASRSNSKIYQYIRSIKKTNSLPKTMHFNNETALSDNEKADLFNRYFHYYILTSAPSSES